MRATLRRVALAAVGVALVASGCSTAASSAPPTPAATSTPSATIVTVGTTETNPHGAHQHSVATVLGRPDRAISGPQGAVPQFVVECAFSHAATDDPIVYPDAPGKSHLHVFFGNTTTDASSTLASLDSGDTSCEQRLDRAAYWAPALLRNGSPLVPVKSTAYYRPGLGVDATTVQPYPTGMKMIAGSAAANVAQSVAIVAWSCGTSSERAELPPTCPQGRDLRLLVTFPDCWNGRDLDSPDHTSHVAYSTDGQCPAGFMVAIPQLQFTVEYPVSGSVEGLSLASGGLLTGHADFINAWDPTKLATEVELCLHRRVVCGVTSGRKTG
ncbi:MAG: DUF1996 domain-containing protein [Ilumatobacteraceae bacterium]